MIEEDARLTYRFLGHTKETELRLIYPDTNRIDLKRVHSEEEFITVCREFDGKCNIYIGINERKKKGTKAHDVISINGIVVDFDSIKEKGYPATDEANMKSAKCAISFMNEMQKQGRNPYLAFSGNGWHVWFKVFIPLSDDNRKRMGSLIKNFQKTIKQKFENDNCKIDNIGDLARVIKVIGTTSVKSKTDDKRVNRVSHWKRKPYPLFIDETWSKKLDIISVDFVPEEPKQITIDFDLKLSKFRLDSYMTNLDKHTKEIYNGDWKDKGYPSRSEAEFYLLTVFARDGVPPEYVWYLMDNCKIGKWQDSNLAYKQLSISKAFNVVDSETNKS